MEKGSIESAVLGAVRKAIDDEEAALDRGTLLEDVGVDSIAGYEIRLILEEQCGVTMTQQEFEDVQSVGGLIELGKAHLTGPC